MNVQDIHGAGSSVADEARLRVSILIDGELDAPAAQHALDELLKSPELGRFWADSHRAGDWMRSDEVVGVGCRSDFMDRFCAVLEREPAIVAPRPSASANEPRRFWLRTGLPGVSVAAAMVAVAWVAGPFEHTTSQPAAVASIAPVTVDPDQVATTRPVAAPLITPVAGEPTAADPEQYRDYIAAHGDVSPFFYRGAGARQASYTTAAPAAASARSQ